MKKLWMLLLVVSIGFGFVKQIKGQSGADRDLSEQRSDAGAQARQLRDELLARYGLERLEKEGVGYTFKPSGRAVTRDPAEFYYDAQYAFAPIVLKREDTHAGFRLVDHEGRLEITGEPS